MSALLSGQLLFLLLFLSQYLYQHLHLQLLLRQGDPNLPAGARWPSRG
jgi:hypothetical protein